ncbi:hypothetical protein LINGRAHAP2_LOCUS30521 [Linum grandiflorum]
MLRASNSWKVTLKYAKYLQQEFDEIANYNWASHIANWLLHGLRSLPLEARSHILVGI